MFNEADSAFAPNFYLFQASAAALALRLRRPVEAVHTEGSACLTGIGGRAGAEGRDVKLPGGTVSADSYRTLVSGDFVDLAAATKLTESQGDNVSDWRNNTLEVLTTTECTVNGLQSINFADETRTAGQNLRIAQVDFRMEGSHRRRYHDELEIRFARLGFSEASINGRMLKITTRADIFDSLPTFNAFRNEFNYSDGFRNEFGHMVYRPASLAWPPGHQLHERRGHATVTVVNKIEWADPRNADPRIVIRGHSIMVPGYGTIYLGEMTISPAQRRLHMVRVSMGSPAGGEQLMASGCPGGHEHP